MSDETLRRLQRAARECPTEENAASLANALARLGVHGESFQDPKAPPERPIRGPHRTMPVWEKAHVVRYARLSKGTCDSIERAVEGRTRRAGRAACESGLMEWEASRRD
jgi:hypothetical protein